MVVLLAAAAYLVHTRRPSVLVTSEFGHLRVYPAWLRPKGLAYVLSGAHGWSTSEEESARDLARSNYAVLGVDTPEFVALLNRIATGCIYLPGVFEDFSRTWQRDANTTQYLPPVLLGSGVGATLVYEAQIAAPPTAFAAAVAVNSDGTIWLHRPFCDHPAAASDYSGQTIKAERPGRNVPMRGVLDRSATAAQRQFASSIPGALPQDVGDKPLHRIFTQALGDIESESVRSGVADLPLAEVPSRAADCRKGLSVLYSGDGGWRDLDRGLADVLATKGMSVVGIDVLRYYWKEKSPDLAARDLERIVSHYQARWHCDKVVLIGFSFGADVLPFIVNHLSSQLRSQVSLITLLSPERTTAFEVQVNGWFGGKPKAGYPIAPELKKISGIPVQCFYGEDEAGGSLCTDTGAGALSVTKKSGGHHFDQNYAELADQILAADAH